MVSIKNTELVGEPENLLENGIRTKSKVFWVQIKSN